MLDHVCADPLDGDVGAVLARDDDRLDRPRRAVDVADRDLRLAVGPQVVEDALLPHLAQAHHELVREHDRHRHQLRRLGARIPEHQPLVTGAERVDTHGDIRGLLVDRRDHRARLVVETELGAGVANVADRVARDARDVHVTGGRNLACHDDEPGREQALACHTAGRVLADDRVQNRVGDLVRDLVGVTFGHRLGRKQVFVTRHRILRQRGRVASL